MSDDDRKNKAREQGEDADESTSSDEAEQAETAAAGDEPAATEGSDDGAAQRVAEALGVEGAEDAAEGEKAAGEGEAAEGDEAAPVQNRAARRAEAAQRRKKRKTATASEGGEEEADLPKDKNARAKELLKRRREQAATAEARPVQLLPSEMVDDALARSASAVGKWLRANFGVLQWVIIGALVAGGGYALYSSQTEKKTAGASDALLAGVRAEHGRVMAEDKRSDEEKEVDPTKVYKTNEERADNALASFRKVVADHPGTGAAILARLGEAGALLDKHEWDKALEAFSAVSSSTLAGADPDVKARALEGIGFAKEGKGDNDGAMASFKELQGLAGFKELGQYHEARLLLAKGDKDKAKDLFKQVHDTLEKPSETRSTGFLKAAVDESLRRIDPTLVPPKPAIGGGAKGAAMSQEEIEKALKRLRENMEKQQQQHKEQH
ncbi:MAG: hypothetical protein QM820_01750 [Minicystis sp.]